MNPNQLFLAACFFMITTPAVLLAQTETFVYDWSSAESSNSGAAVQDNDNWTASVGGLVDDDIIRDAGHPDGFFSGNYYSTTYPSPRSEGGDNVSLYTRENDDAFSFSIPANAATVDLSFVVRANHNLNSARFGLQGPRVVNFGVFGANGQPGKWGVRSVADGPDGFGVTTGGSTFGAAWLSRFDETVKTYRANLSLDMTAPGTLKSVDLVVENLTDGGVETIFDDLPYELGDQADPTEWDTLYLRAASTSVDNLTISYTVPEPTGIAMASCFVFWVVCSTEFGRHQRH